MRKCTFSTKENKYIKSVEYLYLDSVLIFKTITNLSYYTSIFIGKNTVDSRHIYIKKDWYLDWKCNVKISFMVKKHFSLISFKVILTAQHCIQFSKLLYNLSFFITRKKQFGDDADRIRRTFENVLESLAHELRPEHWSIKIKE